MNVGEATMLYFTRGAAVDGMDVEGIAVVGTDVEPGASVGGFAVEGAAVDGAAVDGLAVEGTAVDGGGIAVEGTAVVGAAGPMVAYIAMLAPEGCCFGSPLTTGPVAKRNRWLYPTATPNADAETVNVVTEYVALLVDDTRVASDAAAVIP